MAAEPSPATASRVVARGRSACTTTTRGQTAVANPATPGVGRGVERTRIVDPRQPVRCAHAATSGALETTTMGTVARGARRPPRPCVARARRAASSSSDAREARLARSGTNADRDDDPCGLGPVVRRELACAWRAYATGRGALYPAAKGFFYPGLRYGLRWTIEGAQQIPRAGPVILASNHVSYLDPLTLAYVADRRHRKRPLPRQGRAVRQARARARCCAPRTRSRCSAARPNAADALDAAVDALRRGECVAVFPEGTISLDLEPMVGKSGTARLARRAGVPVTPVGLWGTHRILIQGPQAALAVGRRARRRWSASRCRSGPTSTSSDATDRIMRAIASCVARGARDLPAAPGAGRRRRGGCARPEIGDAAGRARPVTPS